MGSAGGINVIFDTYLLLKTSVYSTISLIIIFKFTDVCSFKMFKYARLHMKECKKKDQFMKISSKCMDFQWLQFDPSLLVTSHIQDISGGECQFLYK